MKFDRRHKAVLALFCLQLMLVHHTYRSTDFEVHRNWLAITYQLPISKWYYEATSEWTLDYPPLFAWFEWALARAAKYFDPKTLVVSNLEYDSDATVLFQRLSVCATSLVLVAAMLHATRAEKDSVRGLTAFLLVVANAGLIMVDNIHFQYNGILLGLLLWSVLMAEEQRYILSGVLFAVLLNMKHLFVYLAPVYFVFLLRHYVLVDDTNSSSSPSSSSSLSWTGNIKRLVSLGGAVSLVCGVSFGPFIAMGQMSQVLSRLLPFGRGLCHAYWAPNAWALYSFADKVAAATTAAVGLRPPSASANMAGGIVGVSSYLILPDVGARTCAMLTLLAIVPCLVALWKAPRPQAGLMFAAAVAYANLCGFMFGYHVHEKGALTVEIPMVLAAMRMPEWGRQYVLLSTAAHVGIFPLLFKAQEIPIRWLLAVVYYMVCIWGLSLVHSKLQRPLEQQQQTCTKPGSLDAQQDTVQDSPVARTRTRSAVKHTPTKQLAPNKHGVLDLTLQECCQWLPFPYRLYLAGLLGLELYCTLGHTALLGDRLPFVPLMLTSVYCAFAFTWTWGWMALWFVHRWSAGVPPGKQD